jgi:hypothetical protein
VPTNSSTETEEASAEAYDLIPDLPGGVPFPAALREQLAPLVRERYLETPARTRHFREDGLPLYSNRLEFETSPYLLQHAHNPVNWFPWGDEAFELAAELDRPVLLSVGYSTCHWCHVMEEESFEDVEIAEYINSHYVAIKVDREQRPDVDDIYMTAVQFFARRGGWPMTVVMTSDRIPFFGATYIPPRDGVRGSRTGFLTVLNQLNDLYHNNTDEVMSRSLEVSQFIAQQTQPSRPGDVPNHRPIENAFQNYSNRFDSVNGGVGSRPKFPTPSVYTMLLRHHRRTGNARSLDIVTTTLENMGEGGIYDQVGGGFHRYSTDDTWLVPHFEKMLYDNAQLVSLFLEAYQVTHNEDFARIARETLDYIIREMTHPEGGFYSATDADSEGEEGLFFIWTPDEIMEILEPADAALVNTHYGVTTRGNFEGENILHVSRTLADMATEAGVEESSLRLQINGARALLYTHRAERIPPLLDDKVLTAWNGLMISAFARGAMVLGDEAYAESGERAARFILDNLVREGQLYRSYREGEVDSPAFLPDYAFLIAGLLDLYEATGNIEWIQAAISFQAVQENGFSDVEQGGYFFTSNIHESLMARQKPAYDGAEPTGNALSAENLLRLAEFTTNAAYRETAERLFAAFENTLTRRSTALPRMLAALDFYLDRPREIVLVTPPGGNSAPFRQVLRNTFLPNRIIVEVTEGDALSQLSEIVPLVDMKVALGGQTTAYVCEAGICERPTQDPVVFAQQIGRVTPYETSSTP